MSEEFERLRSALRGRYHIESEIGAGGMATVYLAQDLRHQRPVALKVLRPELAAALGTERFLREIRIAANLTHPNILPLHDSGEADGLVYYVMPYIEGESLRHRLSREGELPVNEAVRIIREVVDALACAHSHGIVHRDIKPDNVLLSGRHALVTDFGVAKAVSEAGGTTKGTTAGVAIGTPAYMAPEQASGDPHLDHRADIYAVGVLAYELLAGRPPFQGNTPQAVLASHMIETPEPVTRYRPTVSPALASLVMGCLEKKPADRWQTAEDLLRLLDEQITPGSGVTAPTLAPTQPARRWLMPGLALVAVVALAVWWTLSRRTSSDATLDPGLVAVFPFRTSGDSALAYLHEGMVDLLYHRLPGDPGPRAVAPQSVIRGWEEAGGKGGGAVAEVSALSVARRLGAGRAILGSALGVGDKVEFTATMLNVSNGAVLAQATVDGTRGEVLALVDRLTAELLARQGGVGAAGLASVASSSLEAVRYYLAGQASYRAGRYAEASAAFDQAIQRDSTFALAALLKLMSNGWFASRLTVEEDIVLGNYDRLSPRDKILADSWLMERRIVKSVTEGLRFRSRATELLPDRPEAWLMLAEYYFHQGVMVQGLEALDLSRSAFHRAQQLDPDFAPAREHDLEIALRRQDTAEVERRLVTDTLSSYARTAVRWVVELNRDSTAGGRLEPVIPNLTAAEVALLSNLLQTEVMRPDDAIRVTRVAAQAATSASARASYLRQMAGALDNAGRPVEAAEARRRADAADGLYSERIFEAIYGDGDSADGARGVGVLKQRVARGELSPVETVQYICAFAHWDLVMGTPPDASLTVLHRMADDPTSSPQVVGGATWCSAAVETTRAVKRRSPDAPRLVALLDSMSRAHPITEAPIMLSSNLLLVRALEAVGDYRGALEASKRTHAMPLYWASRIWAEAHARQMAGDRAGAIRGYQQYLRLRANPEPSRRPQAEAVRAELTRLLGKG